MKATAEDIIILAKTIWGEARGEDIPGKVAVAYVVLNRAKENSWYGDGIADVCTKPWQFSCWNKSDPNSKKLAWLTLDDAEFQDCLYAALGAVRGHLPDPTQGATHYYAYATIERPAWASRAVSIGRIGGHEFFREVP